ncbi:MAG: sulfur carrier protein ThiS [Candidatus Hydrogenedentes bacterium]|nr:sulfur carrier protein ThiS [Candidatus Hydrogenedentota bacterium]
MKILLNGQARDISDNITVDALLHSLGFKPEATVVERNTEILDRSTYRDTVLADGDTVELVRFVGGG